MQGSLGELKERKRKGEGKGRKRGEKGERMTKTMDDEWRPIIMPYPQMDEYDG